MLFKTLCLELLRLVLRGDVTAPQAVAFFRDLYARLTDNAAFVSGEQASSATPPIPAAHAFYLPNLLADALWLLDIETDPQTIGQAGALPTTHPMCVPYLFAPAAPVPLLNADVRSRLYSLCKEFVKDDFVPAIIMKERFEVEFLENIELVEPKTFSRKIIRTNTVMLYKQQKFNLLREESEGYSKLVTELTSNLPALCDQSWSTDRASVKTNRQAAVRERVSVVLSNVKSLIGYFDLDPNRVLDIILDIFTANLADHWDFFIELLQASPWRVRKVRKRVAPSQVASIGTVEMDAEGGVTSPDGLLAVEEERSVCASVLGFKFAYYNLPENNVSTPPQLFWVAALLIKHDLVKLEDLYVHLYPSDMEVKNEWDEFVDEMKMKEVEAGKYRDSAVS
ncbi:THO complex subunit 2, partial [Nowakowskiella sp. JEL0078]